MPAGLMRGDDVGVAHALDVDVLAALDLGQRADAVAQDRRAFVIHRVRALGHVAARGAAARPGCGP